MKSFRIRVGNVFIVILTRPFYLGVYVVQHFNLDIHPVPGQPLELSQVVVCIVWMLHWRELSRNIVEQETQLASVWWSEGNCILFNVCRAGSRVVCFHADAGLIYSPRGL